MSLSDPESNPPGFKFIGLGLAVGSGLFIGSSFVFKKKGLIAAQRKYETTAGESHAYLKSPMWWTGMTIMILGEVLNFVAYMFADAVLVTPMGALSVVVCAILSAIFLHEHLTLFGKVGCFLCIVGSVIIAINAPEQNIDGNIHSYEHLFIAPGFLTWLGICVVSALILMFIVAPKYGKKNMLVYITVCSVIGGLSVSVTSGLGSAIILSIRGHNQFKYWFTYFLLIFVIVTLLIEINYLNKALELFNTAAVTPTYYVIFTAATIITSVILSQGMRADAVTIVTIVFGFFTICAGIVLLQLSKMDPDELRRQKGLDRKSSMLMSVMEMGHELEKEHPISHIEDPGVDSIRGGMGIVGSIMRAKSSRKASRHQRSAQDTSMEPLTTHSRCHPNVPRYQLYDRPMPPPTATLTNPGSSPSHPASDQHQHVHFLPGSDECHGHHHSSEARQSTELDKPHNLDPHVLVPILENRASDRTSPNSMLSLPPLDVDDTADMGNQSAIHLHAAPSYELDASSFLERDLEMEEKEPDVLDEKVNDNDDDDDDDDDTNGCNTVLLASPTGIVDHYYELNTTELSPSRNASLRRREPTDSPHPAKTRFLEHKGFGLFKPRIRSQGSVHDTSGFYPRHFTVPGLSSAQESAAPSAEREDLLPNRSQKGLAHNM